MSNRRIVPFVVAFGLLVLLVAPLSLAATADQGGAKGDPGKVPGFAIVTEPDSPGLIDPVRHVPSRASTECAIVLLFVNVTVAPALMRARFGVTS